MLVLFEKHTDMLTKQANIKPQETLEFKLSKQMKIFLTRINPFRRTKKWLLGVTILRQPTLFLIYLLKTKAFESQNSDIGLPKEKEKLLSI